MGREMVHGMTPDGIVRPHPDRTVTIGGVEISNPKVTSVPITTGIGQTTQEGAINAALILCTRECQRNHLARCRVCTLLEKALRELR